MSIYAVPPNSPDSNIDTRQVDVLPPVPQAGDIRINAISPLLIPNLVTGLPADENVLGGINLAMTEDRDNPNDPNESRGVSTYIDPWVNQAPGDKWTVRARHINDLTSIALRTDDVSATQLNQRIHARLPGHLLRNGINELYVGVLRLSAGPGGEEDEAQSPRLPVLILKDLPGGPDPDPERPDHQNLAPPTVSADILKNGVTQDQLNRGVEVSCPPHLFMRKNSEITLHWGDQVMRLLVTEADVGQPIRFLVTRSTIEAAGDSKRLSVYYSLRDVVDNRSADNSQRLMLVVNTRLDLLDAPNVNDADENGIVDLQALAGRDALVVISSPPISFVTSDQVVLHYAGVAANGEIYAENFVVPVIRNGRTLNFDLPHYWLRRCVHGQAVLSYTLTRNGEVRRSRSAGIRIDGLPIQLPAPEVPESAGGALPADTPGAQVRVLKLVGAIANDVVRIYWEGTAADGSTPLPYITQRQLDAELAKQDIFFTVARQNIEPLINGRLRVRYEVFRNGRLLDTSEILELFVGVAATQLPAPTVPNAPGDVLIPENFPNGTDAVIAVYIDMQTLDRIVFDCVGTTPAQSYRRVLDLEPAMVGQPVKLPIPAQTIASNRGQSVQLVYTTTNAATQVQRISERRILTIRAPIPVPGISVVRDASNAVIPSNGSTYSTTVTLSGPRGANSPVEILDNDNVIATVPAGAQGIWTSQPLPMTTGSHRFTVRTPGSTQESALWAITVLLIHPVAINSLIDGNNVAIGNGGATFSTTATLRGTATPGEQVQILLNGTVRQNVPVDSKGNWTYTINPLAVFAHRFLARPVPANRPDSNAWVLNVRSEWTDINTLFQNNSYDGWLLHNAARCGSIRGWQGRPMFCNFTDFGAPTGFAGTIFYRDLTFLPGTYQFRVNATHIAEGGPNPNLLNPILSLTEDGQYLRVDRALPKDGRFYDLILNLTVTTRQRRRLYVNNFQDGSNGNDYVISQISVIRTSGGGGGILTAPEEFHDLPPYEGPLPTIDMPQRKK
ncbi:hypothetical protein ACYZTX_24790 [Pseudomonas sp. MDT1-17]